MAKCTLDAGQDSMIAKWNRLRSRSTSIVRYRLRSQDQVPFIFRVDIDQVRMCLKTCSDLHLRAADVP